MENGRCCVKYTRYVIGMSYAVIGAFFLLAYHYNWIHIPRASSVALTPQKTAQKKTMTLYFWYHQGWYQETVALLWTDNLVHNITGLITAWLRMIYQERFVEEPVAVQAIAVQGQTVYCSFDRSPFDKQASTYDSWMWIESLLKTLRQANISSLTCVHFLVHHQPLCDAQLSFDTPWPLCGFIKPAES